MRLRLERVREGESIYSEKSSKELLLKVEGTLREELGRTSMMKEPGFRVHYSVPLSG